MSYLFTGQQRFSSAYQSFFLRLTLSILHEEGESSCSRTRCGNSNQESDKATRQVTQHSYVPKMAKIYFPCFNGKEDPTSLLCWAKQFLQLHAIEDQVALVSFHSEEVLNFGFKWLNKRWVQFLRVDLKMDLSVTIQHNM